MGVTEADGPRIGRPVDGGLSATAFRIARGVDPFGPFVPLLHHPALINRVEPLGRALRYEGSLAADVRESAILATATFWRQPVEWAIHAPEARRAGLSDATLDAIAAGFPPDCARTDIQVAVGFVAELYSTQAVSDETYGAAVQVFGVVGVIELTTLAGYYGMLAMLMNVARTQPEVSQRVENEEVA